MKKQEIQQATEKRFKEIGSKYERRVGNTTKAVDYYIQKLFANHKLVFKYPDEENTRGLRNIDNFCFEPQALFYNDSKHHVMQELFERIAFRLSNEHRYFFDTKDGKDKIKIIRGTSIEFKF